MALLKSGPGSCNCSFMQHSMTYRLSPTQRGTRWRRRTVIAAASTGSQLLPPFNVVVTGSTKGVGRALAEGFVRAGDNVVVCSRDGARIKSTVKELEEVAKATKTSSKVKGKECDVSKAADVAALADFAKNELGTIDMWINNAGTNGYKYTLLMEMSEEDLASIVETNVLGVMLGCREAIRVMRDQSTGGHIFNMDGAGADGGATPRFAAYGTTKRGLVQLGKSLEAELKLLGINNIGIHNLSPGMVTTDLLMAGADTPTAKFFINCLAEEPETVAEFLVPRVRKVPQESQAFGGGVGKSTYIKYLTKPKAYSQIFARLLTGARKNRFVPEEKSLTK